MDDTTQAKRTIQWLGAKNEILRIELKSILNTIYEVIKLKSILNAIFEQEIHTWLESTITT